MAEGLLMDADVGRKDEPRLSDCVCVCGTSSPGHPLGPGPGKLGSPLEPFSPPGPGFPSEPGSPQGPVGPFSPLQPGQKIQMFQSISLEMRLVQTVCVDGTWSSHIACVARETTGTRSTCLSVSTRVSRGP